MYCGSLSSIQYSTIHSFAFRTITFCKIDGVSVPAFYYQTDSMSSHILHLFNLTTSTIETWPRSSSGPPTRTISNLWPNKFVSVSENNILLSYVISLKKPCMSCPVQKSTFRVHSSAIGVRLADKWMFVAGEFCGMNLGNVNEQSTTFLPFNSIFNSQIQLFQQYSFISSFHWSMTSNHRLHQKCPTANRLILMLIFSVCSIRGIDGCCKWLNCEELEWLQPEIALQQDG
jgi:hypothetical protein